MPFARQQMEIVEGHLGRYLNGKKIKEVGDSIKDSCRTLLILVMEDGSEISLEACGCCDGITAYAPVDEETLRMRREKAAAAKAKQDKEDAKNREKGLL